MQNALQPRNDTSASRARPESVLADFDYILRDMRALLTPAECRAALSLAQRVDAAQRGRAPWPLVCGELEAFVRNVLVAES